jgi:hypothetical protein
VLLPLVTCYRTAKVSLTCVVDISEKSLSSANATGNACSAIVIDTSETPKLSNKSMDIQQQKFL